MAFSPSNAVESPVGAPVFICGYPKSGTTLLASLLDGHSDLMVFPEETFFLRQAVLRNPHQTIDQRMEWLLNDPCRRFQYDAVEDSSGNRDYHDFDYGAFRDRFTTTVHDQGINADSHLLRSLMISYAEHTGQVGKRYWVEKTPSNELFLPTALDWYPDLRAIYIVRQPPDCFYSYAKKKNLVDNSGPFAVDIFVLEWAKSIQAWHRHLSRHHRALTVRYEDLVRCPVETLHCICGFLEIEYESTLETPTKNGKLWTGNSMHGVKFSGISTSAIGRGTKALPQEDLRFIEQVLGRAMIWLGYQPTVEVPGFSRVFRLWLRSSRRQKLRMLRTYAKLYTPFLT